MTQDIGGFHGNSQRTKILIGNGTWTDVIGLGLWFIPAHAARNQKSRTRIEEGKSNEGKDEDGKDEENPQAGGNESTASRQEGQFKAFEENRDLGNKIVGDLGEQAVVDRLVAEGYTEILQIQNTRPRR